MNLIQKFLTKNDCYKNGIIIKPEHIVVHSTGANNKYIKRYVDGYSAEEMGEIGYNNYQNGWNHSGITKMVHAFIGCLADGETVATCQTQPLNYKGWHVGKGRKGSYNSNSVGFEICEDDLTDANYFNKVYNEAVEFSAYVCNMFDLDPLGKNVIVCHWEAYELGYGSGHVDVTHWFPKFGKSMDDFRQDVNTALQQLKLEEEIKNMTDEQFAEYMNRYLANLRNKPADSWAEGYLSWAKENGIMAGDEGGNLMPQSFLTRQEMATMLNAFYNKFM